jgi:signal transduction histidine kinase
MIPRLKSRFPLFEAAVLLGVLGIGWALYQTYGAIQNATKRQQEPPPTFDAQRILKLHGVMEIRDHYRSMSEQIEVSFREMKAGLEEFVQDRSRAGIDRFLRQSETLEKQIGETVASLNGETLQGLWKWLGGVPALRSDAILKQDLALDGWSRSAAVGVSNYIAAINVSGEQLALTPEIVQRKIAKSVDAEGVLKQMVSDGRDRAGRLDALVTRRTGDLAELMQPLLPKNNRMLESERVLWVIFYGLAIAFSLQAVVVVVAFYRRLVVIPLHQKIIENNAASEFQRKLDHFARLATGLAHEIRNPLTAINIRLFTLQKALSGGSAEHADTMLIRNEIDRLEQILKNFLKLARPSEPKFTRLTAEPMLAETRTLLADQCWRRGVELKLDAISETSFLGDPVQLKQVLINLVQNAAESIDGKGTITLRARDEELTLADRPEHVLVLEVEDSGCGITPDVQERLYDPFFSTKENGTGLGLPIAAKIVDQHKGKLDFKSGADGGTIFRVILSAERRPEENA